MAWSIEVSDDAKRQLARLSKVEASRITRFLRERVSTLDSPRAVGSALEGSRYRGIWRYRIGDYRVLVDIRDRVLVIVVVSVGHRNCNSIYR